MSFFKYLRLRRVVTVLPRHLARLFGDSDHYTFLQVKRAISDLSLRKNAQPYAFAAACSFAELQRSDADLSKEDYQRLRAELADFFDLSPNFTTRNLRKRSFTEHPPPPPAIGGT